MFETLKGVAYLVGGALLGTMYFLSIGYFYKEGKQDGYKKGYYKGMYVGTGLAQCFNEMNDIIEETE